MRLVSLLCVLLLTCLLCVSPIGISGISLISGIRSRFRSHSVLSRLLTSTKSCGKDKNGKDIDLPIRIRNQLFILKQCSSPSWKPKTNLNDLSKQVQVQLPVDNDLSKQVQVQHPVDIDDKHFDHVDCKHAIDELHKEYQSILELQPGQSTLLSFQLTLSEELLKTDCYAPEALELIKAKKVDTALFPVNKPDTEPKKVAPIPASTPAKKVETRFPVNKADTESKKIASIPAKKIAPIPAKKK